MRGTKLIAEEFLMIKEYVTRRVNRSAILLRIEGAYEPWGILVHTYIPIIRILVSIEFENVQIII